MDCELHHTAWVSWSTSIAATAAIVATALVYLRGWRRLRESAPEIAAGCKPWMSIVGLVVLWISIASPLSTLDHRLLTFHMLQHLLSMTVAAPLILAGAPGPAILRGLPPLVRDAAVTFLRSDGPAGPGARGRSDVVLGDDRVSDPGGRDPATDALAPRRRNPERRRQGSGHVAQSGHPMTAGSLFFALWKAGMVRAHRSLP